MKIIFTMKGYLVVISTNIRIIIFFKCNVLIISMLNLLP
jgi:hypothetical protein